MEGHIDYKAVIEILEEFLNTKKTEILGISVGEERQVRLAIENLIKRVKYLEENRIWSEETISGLKQDFIPKSKIREKIEQYNMMIIERPEHKAIIEIHINELQELLGEDVNGKM